MASTVKNGNDRLRKGNRLRRPHDLNAWNRLGHLLLRELSVPYQYFSNTMAFSFASFLT